MAVSEAFLKAGVTFARRRALRLILTHVPVLIETKDAEKRLHASRGLDHARELGRQHGFAGEVQEAIDRAYELLTPRDTELEALTAMFHPPMREAAE